ncbi:carbohydrate kinase family protein [Escherichia coli]
MQPVSKNIFDVDSYPLERIAMTTGVTQDQATIISRLGHRTALMSRIGKDAAGQVISTIAAKRILYSKPKQDVSIDTSINVGLVTEDGERTFVTTVTAVCGNREIDDVDFARFSQAKLLSLASIFNSPLLDGKALTEIFTQAKTRQMIICAETIKPRSNERWMIFAKH